MIEKMKFLSITGPKADLPAVFVKTPKKKAFLQRDIPMRQPGLQI